MKRRQTPGAEIRDLLHEMTTGDERIEDIDFSHAALYVLALQLVFSIVVASTSAILTTALVPRPSAVRSLVVSTVLSGLMLLSPLRLGNARGTTILFFALRPALGIYIASLIIEELADVVNENDVEPWRQILFQSIVATSAFAGVLRAVYLRSERDGPLLIVVLCGVIAAALPLQAAEHPLSTASVSLFAAAGRVGRATLFASLYALHAYASPPATSTTGDVIIAASRSGGASVWILAAHAALLPVSIVQVILVIFFINGNRDDRIQQPSYRAPSTLMAPGYREIDTRSDGASDGVDATAACGGDIEEPIGQDDLEEILGRRAFYKV